MSVSSREKIRLEAGGRRQEAGGRRNTRIFASAAYNKLTTNKQTITIKIRIRHGNDETNPNDVVITLLLSPFVVVVIINFYLYPNPDYLL
jgi:hypothetical protein